MRYRRADVKGGTYFFTINPAERQRTLLVDYVDTLREAMRMVKVKHPFNIDAMMDEYGLSFSKVKDYRK
jgi:putative transposase